MKPILEINELSVSYGSTQALRNVSLRVEEGTIVSLVGANGAGKSTLMKTIIGMVKPTKGDIHFKSLNILKMTSHEIIRTGISLSPEGREIFTDMTVAENLALGAYTRKLKGAKLNDRMEAIFTYFPILKERRQQMGMTLSGGEQQMLAISRALMTEPELLLLDEPSLGISPLLTEKIFEILCVLNQQGTSILLAEQNAYRALEISSKGYVLELGKVAFEDTSSHLLVNDGVRQAYLGV